MCSKEKVEQLAKKWGHLVMAGMPENPTEEKIYKMLCLSFKQGALAILAEIEEKNESN